MIFKDIVQDESALRVKSTLITINDDIDYMIKELGRASDFYGDNSLGVAGVQVGIQKRIFMSKIEGKRKVYINPEIIKKDGLFIFKNEGCLSYPNKRKMDTWRYKWIEMKYQDRNFINTHFLKPEKPLHSVVIQHELDHFDGALYFDHIQSPVKNSFTIGRNEPCVCGSGRKFKKCCIGKYGETIP